MIEFTEQEKLTIKSYDQNAKPWAEEHNSPDFWQAELAQFRRYLPSGRILEIGSGGGRDAGIFINSGYNYIGTDVSSGLLKEAKQRHPQGEFLQTSLYHLSFPKNTFDGFWASAVLLHIPKDKLLNAFREIRQVAHPGGVGFISVKEGEGEKIEEEVLPNGEKIQRFFAYYSDQEFSCHLAINNMEILRHFKRPMGNTTWLIYFVKNLKTYAD